MNGKSAILLRSFMAGAALVLLGACATYSQPRYGYEGVYYDDRYYPARSVSYVNPVYYPYWSLDYFYFSRYYHPYSVLALHYDPWFYPYPGWYYGYSPGARFSLSFHYGTPYFYPWYAYGFHYHHFRPWRPAFVIHHQHHRHLHPVRRTDLRLRDLQRLEASAARGEMPRRLSDRLRTHAQTGQTAGSPRTSRTAATPQRSDRATQRASAGVRPATRDRPAGASGQTQRGRSEGMQQRRQTPMRQLQRARDPRESSGVQAGPRPGSRAAPGLISGMRADPRPSAGLESQRSPAVSAAGPPARTFYQSQPLSQPGAPVPRTDGTVRSQPGMPRPSATPADRITPRVAPPQSAPGAGPQTAPARQQSSGPPPHSSPAPQSGRGAPERGRAGGRGGRERR